LVTAKAKTPRVSIAPVGHRAGAGVDASVGLCRRSCSQRSPPAHHEHLVGGRCPEIHRRVGDVGRPELLMRLLLVSAT
jgi:hypothetical protein